MISKSLVGVAVCAMLASTGISITSASALLHGSQIEILVKTSDVQPDFALSPTDASITLKADPVSYVDTFGCEGGSFAEYSAKLKTKGTGAEHVNVILLTNDPVKTGDRLNSFTLETSCTLGDTAYQRYRATVD